MNKKEKEQKKKFVECIEYAKYICISKKGKSESIVCDVHDILALALKAFK